MNDKTLDADLADLSRTAVDPLRKVEEAGFWLEAFREGVRADPLRVYQVVDRLDHLVQGHRLELTREYLDAGGRQQTYRERRIWRAVVQLARELAAGYGAALQLFQVGAPNADAITPLVPAITARALRALALELRWTLLRYAAVAPSLWIRTGVLYAFAERGRFLSQQFKPYPAMAVSSTVRREYLRALVLAVSGTENLLPAEQVVAERVIATVAEFFLLYRRASRGCHFAADLGTGRAPRRVSDGTKPARAMRFFGPGDAGMMVETMLRRIAAGGQVPAELGLVGEVQPALVLEVLQHLAHRWSSNPPARAETRERVLSTLDVAHGFDSVLAAVSADRDDADLDELTEAWTAENESSGGFGATLPARVGDWLAIGALVAARPAVSAQWNLGVIRRLSTDANGRRAVGVQILARGGIAVELSPLPADAAAVSHRAVLLTTGAQSNLTGGEVTLVLRLGIVSSSQAYALGIDERNYNVSPRRVLERGDDFEVVSFSVVGAVIG